MNTLQKFQEVANIKFVENNGDVEIGTIMTQDGYNLHYVTADIRDLNFESEVFYYQPEFDAIMDVIEFHRFDDEPVGVACFDIDDYFDEYYMLDYLQSNMDEDKFDEFTNE